jgi:hypothetical protein
MLTPLICFLDQKLAAHELEWLTMDSLGMKDDLAQLESVPFQFS